MIVASHLRKVFNNQKTGMPSLWQSKITDVSRSETWPDFVEDFINLAVYPKPSSNKFECYGWTPALFTEGPNKKGEQGHWRLGALGGEELSLFVADLDNQFTDRVMIDIDALEGFLKSLGLSYLLYTSFTHTEQRHKVRIITPVTRFLTPDEAFKVFTWFNAAFDYQLDGSIYDQADYLYGPPLNSEMRLELHGQPLDVDAYLTLADGLDEEAKNFVPRGSNNHRFEPTPEQIEQAIRMAAINEPSEQDVSIHNAKFFNAHWIDLLHARYLELSRSRSLRGLIAKAWVKSQGTLTKGDLWCLYLQLDALYGGYCVKKYGREACDRDIESAMEAVGSPREPELTDEQVRKEKIEKEIARLKSRAGKTQENV